MEQRLARAEERLDDHDREIKDLKTEMKDVKSSITAVEKDIAIILNDGAHTRDALSKIEAGIDNLRKYREDDHYVKPLSKHEARGEKIWWAVIGGGITALVGAAMAALTAFL